jgi:serine/threonine-protein kinase HipA
VFNVAARNQDDHTKNIAYVMDETGQWHLSPAYDLTYAFNPAGTWTARHQMSVNGKREGIGRDDLHALATEMNIRRANDLVDEVAAAVGRWPEFAAEAHVAAAAMAGIGRTHRLT